MTERLVPARPVRGGARAAGTLVACLLLSGAPAGATSLVGREFWLAWPRTADARGEDPAYDLDAQLVVLAADRAVSVRVTGPGLDRTVSAAPGSPGIVRLARSTTMLSTAARVEDKGIHVAPAGAGCGLFAVLLRVPAGAPSVADEVTCLLPVDLLGERWLPVSYWGHSVLAIVATQDATDVTFDPTASPGCPAPASIRLSRGQTYLHECTDAGGDGSVSGTVVTASAPIALVSGSEASSIINHEGERAGSRAYWGWEDVLLESPWPLDMLGRRHAHAPFRRTAPGASGDLLRIIAGCPDTSARVGEDAGARSWLLPRRGDHVDVESPDVFNRTWRLVPGAAHVESNRGALVQACTVGGFNSGIGDPSLTVLDPVERWERVALAWLPPGYEHSLSIVTEASAAPSVRLDGAPLAAAWEPVPESTLAWTRLDGVTSGEHRVTGDAPLSVQASGFSPGAAGAYSHPAIPVRLDASGTAVGSVRLRGVDPCATTCPGACTTLHAPPGLATHAWSTGATGLQAVACPDVTTVVTLAATDALGCAFEGSATLHVIDAPASPTITGPDSACAGTCFDLAAPAGYDSYAWGGGETTRTITACPAADATYTVTVSGAGGCGGDASHVVDVHDPPVAGDALVTHDDPCLRGLHVTWLEAEWRPGSPGGVYNVYRRDGSCAPVDDPSWELLQVGLPGPPWVDFTTAPGRVYAYMVEAEDAPVPSPCRPGPAQGGSTGRRCAQPAAGLSDPGDPDAGRLVSFSPHLRATGFTRAFAGGPATSVTFAWPSLPPLDPATHVEAWRSADPRLLARVDPLVPGPEWTDADASDAWLLFYKVFNATRCGAMGE